MTALRSWSAVAALGAPLGVLAQAADDAATGQSAWNWAVGIAALVVVLALARVMFGRGAGQPPRRTIM
jgi:hypothetical protein